MIELCDAQFFRSSSTRSKGAGVFTQPRPIAEVFPRVVYRGVLHPTRMPGHPAVAYLVTLPLDEEKRLAPTFDGGIQGLSVDMMLPQGFRVREMDLWTCLQLHVRVPPELSRAIPTRVVVRPGKQGYLSDFGLTPWGGWGLVSEAFVQIAEQLEPNTNEFLPIAETLDHRGRAIEKRFFLMNILQQFNAVDVENSTVEIYERQRSTRAADGTERQHAIRTMRFLQPHTLVLKGALIAEIPPLARDKSRHLPSIFLATTLPSCTGGKIVTARISPGRRILRDLWPS